MLHLVDALELLTVPPPVLLDPAAGAVVADGGQAWQIPIGTSAEIAPVFEQLLVAAALVAVPAAGDLVDRGVVDRRAELPDRRRGCRRRRHSARCSTARGPSNRWRQIPARIDSGATIELRMDEAPVSGPVGFRSAAATDVGLAREINQDAFIERPDAGVWVVADGLGGHRDGEVASRMVCDALAEFAGRPDVRGHDRGCPRAAAAGERASAAHRTRQALADRSGSTVVVLLVRGAQCAILWAGDSRVYRWRAGRLEQLTRDHSVQDSERLDGRDLSNAVTRAVGVQKTLSLDLLRDTVRPGDRFLLCSDGLTRTLPEEQIRELAGEAGLRRRGRRVDQGHARRRRSGQRDGADRRGVRGGGVTFRRIRTPC